MDHWDKKMDHPTKRVLCRRLYFVSPSVGERYFLRTLLTKVKGAVSFEALRTINGVVHDTFKSACITLVYMIQMTSGMPAWKKQLACK